MDEKQKEWLNNLKTADPKENNKETDNKAENALEIVAAVVLACGIMGAILCLFLCFPQESFDSFDANGLVTLLLVLVSTLVVWGLLKVVANISKTLKEINKKM